MIDNLSNKSYSNICDLKSSIINANITTSESLPKSEQTEIKTIQIEEKRYADEVSQVYHESDQSDNKALMESNRKNVQNIKEQVFLENKSIW